jgi:hypothetical protein
MRNKLLERSLGKRGFNKKGFEMSFAWIFSLIVGAVIIFIAIFVAMNLVSVGQKEVDVKTVQSVINSIDGLQTTGQQAAINEIRLVTQSRIYLRCEESGDFGKNRMSVAQKSSFKDEWTDSSGFIEATANQYIFAEDEIEGDKIYTLSLPFEMPFKIADIIILHTKEYCFVSPPRKIEDTIRGLSGGEVKSLQVVNNIGNCNEGSVKVCFNDEKNCNISANISCEGNNEWCSGIVNKTYVAGNLIYARIFSSSQNYNCGEKRLLMRTEKLADMYIQKSAMRQGDCPTASLIGYLESLKEEAKQGSLSGVWANAEELDKKNKELQCRLY